MHVSPRAQTLLAALSLASLLALGCDPKGAAGALGASPEKALDWGEIKGEPAAAHGGELPLPGKPGPDQGGVTPPSIPPQIDPLHDPVIDPLVPDGGKGGIDGGEAPLPWKLTNPAGKAGCRCHLECGPRNDDGSKDCITICDGGDC
jgi:hypothetical protein